ncbi:Scp160p RNJ42_03268 [Nakaseomyces bracarensis]|uniref:Scp160p n=1 Tax=Nakaseomyces bracarensis TaxID=273131 RepID=UPI0038720AFE
MSLSFENTDEVPATAESSTSNTDITQLDSLNGDSVATDASSNEETKVVSETPKPLPSLKDLPSLVDQSTFTPPPKVEWGPNMKPAPVSKSISPSVSPSPSATSAGRMRSSNIQETFTLDLDSQLSVSKLELSRILQTVKQSNGVSVESTLSRNTRTFLISGAASKVKEAKRELIKMLTKPITENIEVPTRSKAAIIGSGGKTIREISDRYDVKIHIEKEPKPNSYDEDLEDDATEISIFGDFESVSLAKKRILSIVNEDLKNITSRLTVDNQTLAEFINVNELSSESVKCQYYKESGYFVITGSLEEVKKTKARINDYLKKLSNELSEETVKIPSKFQFLIDAKELKEKFSVIVTFPEESNNDNVVFAGLKNQVTEAIAYARASSKEYIVDSLDIAKAHSKNVEHAKYLALYFHKYNVLDSITKEFPDIKYVLPPVNTLENSSEITIYLSAKTDKATDMKAARRELIAAVNNVPPSETLVIKDLDYELFGKNIKHILLGSEEEARFIQLGDFFPGNDSIVLFATSTDEDFKPSAEEIKETLEKVNSTLEPLRKKQENFEVTTYDLEADKQEEFFGKNSVTLGVILHDISTEDGHIQIKLHTPNKNQMTLRGDQKAVKIANKDIKSIVENPSTEEKEVVEVPSNVVSRLIGNKGNNLQALRKKFDCQIDVPQQASTENEKTVEITLKGLEFNIKHAKKHIAAEAKKLADIVSKELVAQSKYHRNLAGPQGIYRNRLQDKYNVHINFLRENNVIVIRGPSRGVTKAYEELSALLDFEMENGHKTIVNVPVEHMSRIIGKNGDTINGLSADFGVQLDFLQKSEDPKVVESGNVELEITGSRTAIKEAAAKVQTIVSEASDNVTETLDIDRKYHRMIVGPGGHTLREIISNAGGDEIRGRTVDIPNADAESSTITVQGPKKFVSAVVKAINKIVEDGENSITKKIEVPAERLGALIGPGGIVRKQLESEFSIILYVPKRNEEETRVSLTGLPENVEKAEKKIFTEIIKDNYDVEIMVPANVQNYVSDRGTLPQKLRVEKFVNVRYGNSTRKANSLNRAPVDVPVERVQGADGEKFKFTVEEVGPAVADGQEGEITWRLTYEPIDFDSLLEEDSQNNKKVEIDEEKKKQTLSEVKQLIETRISEAPSATYAGYVWTSDASKLYKVVGLGGSNIKKTREDTNCIIHVPKKSDKVNDVIYIRGTKENVEKAGELVLKSLKR